MASFKRFALFFVPDGSVYTRGAGWLGWDSDAGRTVANPSLPDLGESIDALTRRPRKYGFHGTVKPPFALSPGTDYAALTDAVAAFCASRPPVTLPAMVVRRMGRFVALTPLKRSEALANLASSAVKSLDRFRAPTTEDELAKRRKHGLSARQEQMLQHWGYPYVMEEFRFHMTMTGPTDHADQVCDVLRQYFAPDLARPLDITALCLVGEDEAGWFHVLQRFKLQG